MEDRIRKRTQRPNLKRDDNILNYTVQAQNADEHFLKRNSQEGFHIFICPIYNSFNTQLRYLETLFETRSLH
jgi:hypothetical protein